MEMILVMFIVLFIGLLLGAPIYISLTLSSMLAMFLFGNYSLSAVVQRIFGGMDKFALMSLPFYVLAAEIMIAGGMSKRLLNLVSATMGSFRGSLALTTQGACLLFGALSGSSPATVMAIGSMMYPKLNEGGYSKGFSAGLITSSGAVAILIPPSITFIIYGATTGVSIGALFMAGFGAGATVGAVIMVFSYYFAVVHNVPCEKASSFKEIWSVAKEAIWSLGVPIIILGGIAGGVFTPTEAAGVSVVYALFVCCCIHKELSWSQFYEAVIRSAETIGQLMILLGTAALFGWLLAISFFPQLLTMKIVTLVSSKYTMLFIVNIVFLIAGMFIDSGAAIMILVPLIYLPLSKLGIDPVHLGAVIVTNLAIGMFTPPFGLNLFVARTVTGLPIMTIYRSVLPFIFLSLIALGLVTYFPAITLFFVNLAF